MNLNLSKIATSLTTEPWMLPAPYYEQLAKQVESLMNKPVIYSPAEPHVPRTPNTMADDNVMLIDSTCVINVSGMLVKGITEMEEAILGLVNTDDIAVALDEAAADGNIKNIVLVFNSPGGTVTGIEELGRKIKLIDENIKPIYGWCETACQSAAYWLMSQTRPGYLSMTPSAKVGSVGVFLSIKKAIKAMDMQGITVETFSAGEYKLITYPYHDLTDPERAIMQAGVDAAYRDFKAVVSTKRPKINQDDLNGLSYYGPEAMAKGFVDHLYDDFFDFLVETTN